MATQAHYQQRPVRASFAQRAAQDPNLEYDEELYSHDDAAFVQKQATRRQQRQNTSAPRIREPQAALHVPKSHQYFPEADPGPNRSQFPITNGKHTRPRVTVPVTSPDTSRPTNQYDSDRSGRVRRGSLPDRSPLQQLQGKLDDISKEEKRARIEEAERRAAFGSTRQTTTANGDARHRSDRYRPGLADNPPDVQIRSASDPHKRLSGRVEDTPNLGLDGPPVRRHSTRQKQGFVSDGANRYSATSAYSRGHSGDYTPQEIYQEEVDDELYRRNSKSRHRRGPSQGATRHEADRDEQQPVRPNAEPAKPGRSIRRPDSSADRDSKIDVLPGDTVKNANAGGPPYRIPPQTATAIAAKARVDPAPSASTRDSVQRPRQALATQQPEEWRAAGTAKLELDDLFLDDSTLNRRNSKRDSRSRRSKEYDSPIVESTQGYSPSLFVRCGPLLRYTGLRRDRRSRQGDGAIVEREIWRGSVMIVTEDQRSSYSAPVLKLFAQPMELLQTLPVAMRDDLPNDYVDPIAGQLKLSRTGRPTYVKPVKSLPEAKDLSQEEVDDGLFETHRSSSNKIRIRPWDGERLGKFKEVRGARLHSERGLTFWRFNIEVELGVSQARIAYRINDGPATGFWVPARGHTMNIMFHSCNGFSLTVDTDNFSGPDPLWRDVLNSHNMKPYHVMLGGGDQIYNDQISREATLFKRWQNLKDANRKYNADFSPAMQDELETLFLNRYCVWFSRGLFSLANSQIPMVNMWDDHDIIDGFGSYPHDLMRTKVMTGLGTIAFKYYMLFQQQSVTAETYRDEPSWLLGAAPGPYIHQQSRSMFMFLGRKVGFLAVDCRTERTKDEVLCQETYDQIFNRCRAEIVKGETKHLIVLLTVPIAYPRLNFLENILTSRAINPIKAIGRTGALGGFVNKFDGGAEILDDLDDHWTARHHKQERNWFIQELQELAAEKSIRITILGGDVHLGAVGRFYSQAKFGLRKDQDHRYMPNVISSAIVNTPPPTMLSDILHRRNKVHHLDAETDEDMIQMFAHDVDGRPRKNKTLMPRRNYCTIREYVPGSTPPQTPSDDGPPTSDDRYDKRRFPPGSMGRSRSLTRSDFRPRNLIRRLSGSRSRDMPQTSDPRQRGNFPENGTDHKRSRSLDSSSPQNNGQSVSYFPPVDKDGAATVNTVTESAHDHQRPTNLFRRRPTDLADYRLANQGTVDENAEDEDDPHAINLEGGLDICLNTEISQHDPAGFTVPYRLLVPALFYAGSGDINTTRFTTRRGSFIERLRNRRFSRSRRSDVSPDGSRSGDSRPASRERVYGAAPQPINAEANAVHPDDRLRFADQGPSRHSSVNRDPRRDSKIATLQVQDDIQSPHGTSFGPERLRKNPAAHLAAAAVPATQHGRSALAATSPLPPVSPHDEDEAGFSKPRRKSFLDGLRRRLTGRRQNREYDDESVTDDADQYSLDSEADVGDHHDPRGGQHTPTQATPSNSDGRRLSGQGGPTYRPADEPIYRNDARVTGATDARRRRLQRPAQVQAAAAVPARSSMDGRTGSGRAAVRSGSGAPTSPVDAASPPTTAGNGRASNTGASGQYRAAATSSRAAPHSDDADHSDDAEFFRPSPPTERRQSFTERYLPGLAAHKDSFRRSAPNSGAAGTVTGQQHGEVPTPLVDGRKAKDGSAHRRRPVAGATADTNRYEDHGTSEDDGEFFNPRPPLEGRRQSFTERYLPGLAAHRDSFKRADPGTGSQQAVATTNGRTGKSASTNHRGTGGTANRYHNEGHSDHDDDGEFFNARPQLEGRRQSLTERYLPGLAAHRDSFRRSGSRREGRDERRGGGGSPYEQHDGGRDYQNRRSRHDSREDVGGPEYDDEEGQYDDEWEERPQRRSSLKFWKR